MKTVCQSWKKLLMNVVHEPGEIITLLRYFLSPSLPEPTLKEISTKSRILPLSLEYMVLGFPYNISYIATTWPDSTQSLRDQTSKFVQIMLEP
jgi:hypothetical protein